MISPEGMVPASNVVYLAYNASGPRHYDVLIISQRDQQEQFTSETNSNLDALESQSTLSTEKVPISTPRKPCRCQKNKYKSKAKASRNYKGRCKCINEHGTCMSACSCCGWCQGKQCGGNQRLPRDKKCGTPRKRSKKYKHTVKAKRSRLSLEENDEKIKDPGLNELEFFVMHAITQHANSKKDVKNENSQFCDMFSKIVKVVNSFALLIVLPIIHHSLQVLYDEKRKYDKLRKR